MTTERSLIEQYPDFSPDVDPEKLEELTLGPEDLDERIFSALVGAEVRGTVGESFAFHTDEYPSEQTELLAGVIAETPQSLLIQIVPTLDETALDQVEKVLIDLMTEPED